MSHQEVERSMWSDEEVYALLGIWSDASIASKLDGTCRNAQIYREICARMADKGFTRTVNQIKYKMKNLKKEYRKVVDHNNRSGKDRRTIKYQDELSLILGDRPSANPVCVRDVGSEPFLPVRREDSTDEESSTSYVHEETDDESYTEESDEETGDSQDQGSPQGPSSPESPNPMAPEPETGLGAMEPGTEPGTESGREPGSGEHSVVQPGPSGRKRRGGRVAETPRSKLSKKGLMAQFIEFQTKADERYRRDEEKRQREQRELEEKWRKESMEQEKRLMDSMTSFMSTMASLFQQSTQPPNMQPTYYQPWQNPSSPHQPWQNPPSTSPYQPWRNLSSTSSQQPWQTTPSSSSSHHGVASRADDPNPTPLGWSSQSSQGRRRTGGQPPFTAEPGVDPRFLPK